VDLHASLEKDVGYVYAPDDDDDEIDLSQMEAETDLEQTYESYDLDMLSDKDFLY